MAQSVEASLAALLAREGGYADQPADRGGPTMYGVTEAVARAAGYAGPMRLLPRATAMAIYRERYWTRPGLDRLAALSPAIADELFDTGVNMGPAVAAGFLQRALNALNRGARDWKEVPPTRAVDSATLAAVKALLGRRGAAGEAVLLKALNCLQGARYIELAEGRPANEAFVYGWLDARVA